MKITLFQLYLLFIFTVIHIVIYSNIVPLYHEEPRRALIAEEMLLSKNFIKPTVLKETYLKKPPFQQWCIALTSLGDKYISNFEARLPSILSYILLTISLFILLPTIEQSIEATIYVLLSLGFLFSYAGKAEPDMLFSALFFLSFFFYIKGTNTIISTFVSSLCMALSILTKGISPIFFYPPILISILFFESSKKNKLKSLLIHFLLSTVFPALWILLLSMQIDIKSFFYTTYEEMFFRSSFNYKNYVAHLFSFPFKIILATVPSSLLLIFRFKRQNFFNNRIYVYAIFIFLWIMSLLWAYPFGSGRYFLPAIPFLCIVASYHIDKQKSFNITLKKIILFIFALSLIIGIPFYFFKGFYIQTIIFIIILIFIFYYYKKSSLNLLADTIILMSIYTVIFFHGPYFYKTKAYFDYNKKFSDVVNVINTLKYPIYFYVTTKDDIKLAFFITRNIKQPIGVLNKKENNNYFLLTYNSQKNCKILDIATYKNKNLLFYKCY